MFCLIVIGLGRGRMGGEPRADRSVSVMLNDWSWKHSTHGIIARWFDSCLCHSEELKGVHQSYKRRRALELSTGHHQCVWVGKKLCPLAHGHAKVLSQKMKDVTCNELTATLLTKPPDLVARALEIITTVKARW